MKTEYALKFLKASIPDPRSRIKGMGGIFFDHNRYIV
jgi:hypothetical protein